MKIIQAILTGLLLLVSVSAFAQETAVSSVSATPMLTSTLTPNDVHDLKNLSDEQLQTFVASLSAAPLLTTNELPHQGAWGFGYFSLQHPDWPALPGDVIGLPAWQMSEGYLLDDVDYDYNAAIPAKSGMRTMALDGPPTPPGDGDGTNALPNISFPGVDYGTNLWIAQVQITNGMLTGIASNTIADVQYEVQSRSDLTATNWYSSGQFIFGSELTNWTALMPLTVSLTNNLFVRLRSDQSSDDSGLPDWWELAYGVSDPYGDPDGDGWNNLQEYQNGTDPNSFNTPAAPQGVTAQIHQTNQTAMLSWSPSGGPVTGYVVEKTDSYLSTVQTFSVSSTAASFADDLSGDPLDGFWADAYDVSYRVQTLYAGGNSSWSHSVGLQSSVVTGSIIPGPDGNPYLVVFGLPAKATAVRLYYTDYDAAGFYGDYSYNFSHDIPLTAFTNGMYPLPASYEPPTMDGYGYTHYDLTIQSIDAQGNTDSAYDGFVYPQIWHEPWYDGRVQLKQNLIFQLRGAVVDKPFKFYYYAWDDSGYNYLYDYYYPPTTHVAASFLHVTDDLQDTGYANSGDYFTWNGTLLDPLKPFRDNVLFANFAYDSTNVTGIGWINTGVSYYELMDGFDVVDTDLQLASPKLFFTPPAGNGATVAGQLPPENTQWLCSLPIKTNTAWGTFNGKFYDNGIIHSNETYTLTANTLNMFGLPFVAERINMNADYGPLSHDVSAGQSYTFSDNSSVNLYSEVGAPEFQTVEYDFWPATPVWNADAGRFVEPWLPGSESFSPTNQSQTLLLSVGNSLPIAGYAKLEVTNSAYTGVYAYLGQYFDKAYAMTNGVATTNQTGVLSPYGDFFATEPGPAALVTMPDVDTGERGTGVVYCVGLAVDANHDGNMDLAFNSADVTSQANPMKFWINNDHDWSDYIGDVGKDVPSTPDYSDYTFKNISSQRDLEDFARLWICGLPPLPASQSYSVTLSMVAVTGNPAVNLVQSVETNGGIGYLTDTNIAAAQTSGSTSADPSYKFARITVAQSYTFPDNYFTNNANKYFLFEGAGVGEGQLTLTVYQGTNTIAQTSAYIDLHDITDFYEQAHTANIDTAPPSTKVSTPVKDKTLPANPAEDQQVIVFVHGLNVGNWEYHSESETMLKRLYWQGYHGRFAAFDWPSPLFALIPIGTNEISYFGFNTGEYISWHSGAALKAYIDDLHTRLPGYTMNLAVHSLGNVAANEAIREGAQVDNYALMQAAISAGAFDGNNSALNYDYLATTASSSPDANALGGYGNCATNATRRVNFYNDDDYALYQGIFTIFGFSVTIHTWEGNQLDYKPDINYSFDGTSCFYSVYDSEGDFLTNRTVTEDFEKKAFIARSRTKAVGAAGLKYPPYALTGGVISTNISLQNASLGFVGGAAFGATRPEHSGEFTKPIQNTTPFYFQLMKSGFQLQPRISP